MSDPATLTGVLLVGVLIGATGYAGAQHLYRRHGDDDHRGGER
jgi:hypothetical protein